MNKESKYQLLVALISNVGLVASFPYGAMEAVCFFFIGMSLLLCLLFMSFYVQEKRYWLAFLLLAINVLFTVSSVTLWTKYDYSVNIKTHTHVINKQDAKEFDIVVAQYEQIRIPVIDGKAIKADAFAVFDSWYENIKDKSRVTVEPSSINYIMTLSGNGVAQMFYEKERKYVIGERTAQLSSLHKNAEGDAIYTTADVRTETSSKEIPDTLVYHICKYDTQEFIDSLVFKCKSTDIHNLNINNRFTSVRHRSLLRKLKDFFFVDELR